MNSTLINKDPEYLKFQEEFCNNIKKELPFVSNIERCIELAEEVICFDTELCAKILKKASWFINENCDSKYILKILDFAMKIEEPLIFFTAQEKLLTKENS
ncbi:MAG TPA: hypothetical protein P5096_02185 [Patescibacteria group bacterium]|nr:hypothetical protein [Patescibacteria group bacterium]